MAQDSGRITALRLLALQDTTDRKAQLVTRWACLLVVAEGNQVMLSNAEKRDLRALAQIIHKDKQGLELTTLEARNFESKWARYQSLSGPDTVLRLLDEIDLLRKGMPEDDESCDNQLSKAMP